MALTEKTVLDRIEILENGVIQVREAVVIERDGAEIARSFHRYVLDPADDVEKPKTGRLDAVAKAVWTKQVVDDRKAAKEALKAADNPQKDK